MNLYGLAGTPDGVRESMELSERLKVWHDAMVMHERVRRARGGSSEICDDECPHAEARMLWDDAVAVLGDRAHELSFLRAQAQGE